MSEGRISASASLQSSVGVTSAEELAEKYQKLFSEHSRIKAQHSVLKKAVRKEQVTNQSLQEECKTKEQELRSSLQQLDLLNFHNERLTKRIQSLQDSGNARLSTGWLLGSTKKEIEKLKASLEARSIDLTRKIEENEKLHKELYEVNSLYTQHVNVLQSNISELEKKKDELQMELTRAHLASEETISTMRLEKREVEVKLDDTRRELQLTNALMEKNEQKLREDDDVLRAELSALRQALSINLGTQSEQFNALSEKIGPESNEIIKSFKKLQFSTRDYLNALKENSDSSHELSIEVKEASQEWLQTLANKFKSAQEKISELTAEKELLVKANENDSNKVSGLEIEISRLRKELEKQKVSSNDLAAESSQNLNNNNKSLSDQNSTKLDNSIGNSKLNSNESTLKLASQNDEIEEGSLAPKLLTDLNDEEEDDEQVKFVYPGDNGNVEPPVSENKDSTKKSKPILDDDDDDDATGNGIGLLARDINVRKDDDAKHRENLIKNHYENKITQLTERLQLADSKATRFYKALEIMQGKLTNAESKKSRDEIEIAKLQDELAHSRSNHLRSVETMQTYIEQLTADKERLESELAAKAGPSSRN